MKRDRGSQIRSHLVGLVLAAVLTVSAQAQALEPATPARLADQSLLLDAANAGDHTIAVGAYGHILAFAADGSWTQRPSPVRQLLTAVFFIDANNGWAVGHDAVIVNTADGGRSWTVQHYDPELEQPLFDVLFLDAMRGFAAGAYGLLLGTVDGGDTWEEVEYTDMPDYHLNALVSLGDDRVLALGESGTAFRSDDGGDTWVQLDYPYNGSIFGAVVHGERVVAFGLRGRVFTSDDGGDSWIQVATDADLSLMGGTVLADGRIVLAGLNGLVLVSSDGGGSFARYRHPSGDALSGIAQTGARLSVMGEGGIAPLDLAAAAVD